MASVFQLAGPVGAGVNGTPVGTYDVTGIPLTCGSVRVVRVRQYATDLASNFNITFTVNDGSGPQAITDFNTIPATSQNDCIPPDPFNMTAKGYMQVDPANGCTNFWRLDTCEFQPLACLERVIAPPVTSVLPFEEFGCAMSADEVRTEAESRAGLNLTDDEAACFFMATNLADTIETPDGCLIQVQRVWEFESACDCPPITNIETFAYTVPLVPMFDCEATIDLGCLYNPDIAPLLITQPAVSNLCDGAEVSSTLSTVQTGCVYTATQVTTASNICPGAAASCTQRFTYTVDVEPPKVVCPPGRSLGCVPDGVEPADYVALAAPLASDLANVVVTEGCTNCVPEVCLLCDTYFTNGCVVTLDRKISATDCCGNIGICSIVYTMNDVLPAITNLPTGGYMGCQECTWRPPAEEFGFTCPYDPSVTNMAMGVCNGPLTWTQLGGVDPGNAGLFVNAFTSNTPAGTVLSYGTVGCGGGVSVDFEVAFNFLNVPFTATGLDPAANNAFVIQPNGFADLFTSIARDPNSGASITMNFFQLGTYVPATGAGIPTDFALSLLSVNDQPPAGGIPIIRLNTIEELYIASTQAPASCGVSNSNAVTYSDPFAQLDPAAAVPPGFDFTLKWEAPGFGNDLNGNGRLEVNEAEFSMNLPASSSLTLVRGADRGIRSGVGFNGAVSPPSGSGSFVIPECGTNVTEAVFTNGCEVTIVRTYTVTGCCEQTVSEDVVYTFTKLPDLSVGPLAKLDLGCIASTNQIPPVDLTMLAATSDCAIVSIQKLSQTAPVPPADGDCVWSNERVFVIETLCGVTQTVTQAVCWVLNNTRPEILSVSKFQDFGCVDTDPRPLADSFANLVVTNATSTQLVSQVRMVQGCEVMIIREWRVEDCCGNFDRREETYIFTPAGGMLAAATITPTTTVGCVTSEGLIPLSQPFDFRATGRIFCYPVTQRIFDERFLIRNDVRGQPTTFPIVSPGGGFFIDGVTMNDDGGFLTSPPESTTATFSSPVTFSASIDNLNNDGICITPPDALILDPAHSIVTTNGGLICIQGTAGSAELSTAFYTNISSITVAGFDGTADFRVNTDFTYEEELTEIVDADGTLTYLDGNGNTVALPANAELCREGCEIEICLVGTQASVAVLGPCESAFDRVWEIKSDCDSASYTQTVVYTLNEAPPRITEVAPFEDFGCSQVDPRPLADSLAAIQATDTDGGTISTQLVMETAVQTDCDITVTRTWRVQDCCGGFDLKDEVYQYTLEPTGISFLNTPEDLDLGCITSANQVPPPVPSLYKSTATGIVVSASQIFSGDTGNTTQFNNGANVGGGATLTGGAGALVLTNNGGANNNSGFSGTSDINTLLGSPLTATDTLIFNLKVDSITGDLNANGVQFGLSGTPSAFPFTVTDNVLLGLRANNGNVTVNGVDQNFNVTEASLLDGFCVSMTVTDAGYTIFLSDIVVTASTVASVPNGATSTTLTGTFAPGFFLTTFSDGHWTYFAQKTADPALVSTISEASVTALSSDNPFTCDALTMWVSDTVKDTDMDDCTTQIERVFMATNDCGLSITTTQCITYIESTIPVILEGPTSIVWACTNAPPIPSVADDLATIVAARAAGGGVTNNLCLTPIDFVDVGALDTTNSVGNFNNGGLAGTYVIRGRNNQTPTNLLVATFLQFDTSNLTPADVANPAFAALFQIDYVSQLNTVNPATVFVGTAPNPWDTAGSNFPLYSDAFLNSGNIQPLLTGVQSQTPPQSLTLNFTSIVQDWVNGVTTNNGITLYFSDDSQGAGFENAKLIASQFLPDATCLSTQLVSAATNQVACDVSVMRTYEVVTTCGERTTTSVTYDWIETPEPPVISGPALIELGCIADAGQVPVPSIGQFTVQAACGASIAFVETSATNTVGCLSTFTRTYSATDLCDQTTPFTQTVSYVLAIRPTITGGVVMDFGCTNGLPVGTAADWSGFTVTGEVSSNSTLVVVTNGCSVTATRTYTVVGCCGDSAGAQSIFTWQLLPPLFFGQAGDLALGCIADLSEVPPPAVSISSFTADCGIVSADVIDEGTPLNDGCTGHVDRVYQLTDPCGQTAVITQRIHWINGAEPEILEVETGRDFGCQAAGFLPAGSFTATNAVSSSVTNTTTIDGCVATIQRTYRIVNCCGEVDTRIVQHTYTIRPDDPSIDALDDIDAGCIASLALVPQPNTTLVAASSSCAVVDIAFSHETNALMSVCTSSVERVYRATDLCGGAITVTQLVSWTLDTTDPAFTAVPAGSNYGCVATMPPLPSPFAGVVFTNAVASNVVGVLDTSDPCLHTMTRTYTVTDCCGDTAEAVVVFTWKPEPTTAPMITGPAELPLGCIDNPVTDVPPANPLDLTVGSVCPAVLVHTGDDIPVESNCLVTIVRNWEAASDCGPTGTFVQTITYTLDDTEPKFASLPPPVDHGCDLPTDLAVDIAALRATVTDTCDSAVAILFTGRQIATNGCQRTMVRSFMAMDACGNAAVAAVTHIWTVEPPPPTLTGPATFDYGCVTDASLVPDPGAPELAALTATVTCAGTPTHFFDGPAAPLAAQTCVWSFDRVYRVEDACGQAAVFTQVVSYIIEEIPVRITDVPAPQSFSCLAAAPLLPTIADFTTEGDVQLRTLTVTPVTNGCEVTAAIAYEITGCCGSFDRATVDFTWTVLPPAPQISGPDTIALGCIPSAGLVPVPSASQFALAAPCGGSISHTADSDPSTDGCQTTVLRTYTATDNCGQASEFVQTITYSLANMIPEIVVVPANADLGCNGVVPPADWSEVVVGGDVLTSNITDSVSMTGCDNVLTRTWRVADCCGNTKSRSTTYRSTDDSDAPVLAAVPGFSLGPDFLGCNPGLLNLPPVDTAGIQATDNCGNVPVQFIGDTISTNGCTGTVTRVYGATDDCGNSSTITQMFSFLSDTVAPEPAIIPASLDLGCIDVSGVPGPEAGVFAVAVLCGNPVVETNLIEEISTNIGCRVVLTRMYQITDECGNTGVADQTITWTSDATPPQITCPPDESLGCNPLSIPAPNAALVVATDACGQPAVAHVSDTPSTKGCTVTLLRMYRATDGCGNVSDCVQTLTWTDDTDVPTHNAPADLALGCNPAAIPDAGFVATDNCGVTTGVVETVSSAGCAMTLTRTWTLLDPCGNEAVHVQTVTWTDDTEAPGLIAPSDLQLGCNPVQIPGPNPALVQAVDGCGAPAVEHVADTETSIGCVQTIERVYRATDACGNAATATQTITWVADAEAPTHNAPADMMLGCNPAAIPAAGFQGADNCGLATNFTAAMTIDGCDTVLTRTWILTDACGNETVHVQTLTWTDDTTAPGLIAPPDLELGCNPAQIPGPNPSLASAVDACGGATIEHVSDTPTDNGCARVITRVYRATDACGNESTAVQTIAWTSSDVPPQLTGAPTGTTLPCNAMVPAPDPSAVMATAGCGDATVSLAGVITNRTDCQTTVVHEYHITDVCGNQTTHQVQFNVPGDSTAPALDCPGPRSLEADTACGVELPDLLAGVASDNCDLVEVTQEPAAGTRLGLGNQTVTITAVDACGNESRCAVAVTVTGGCTPRIDLQKLVAHGHDADCSDAAVAAAGGPVESLTGTNGTPVTWCLRVENTGTVPLDDVTVEDRQLSFTTIIPGLMQPGDIQIVGINSAIAGDLVNTASVSGEPLNGSPTVNDADPAEVHPVNASIVLRKTVAIGANAQCPASEIVDRQAGDMVTYCFEVDNTGDVPLTNVMVMDPMLSATPIPVTGTLLPGQTAVIGVPDMFMGALITNYASALGDADSLPDSPRLSTPLDPAVVTPPCGCVGGTVFTDLGNDGSSDGDNLANLGIRGVTVQLYDTAGTLLDSQVSAADGRYEFSPLMSGSYEVRYDPATLPGGFNGEATRIVSINTCVCLDKVDLPATPAPTAVRLIGFDVTPTETGLLFLWETSWEENVLGYHIVDSATGNVVSPRLVLAGEGVYAIDVPGLAAGRYELAELSTDLKLGDIAAVEVLDAAPQGQPTEFVEATDGKAQFTTEEGVQSYLVTGFDHAPKATTSTGEVLKGALLEADGMHSIYLSPEPGIEILVE